jgi:hypothetical protein
MLPVADEIVLLVQQSGDRERAVDGRMWRLVAFLEFGDVSP